MLLLIVWVNGTTAYRVSTKVQQRVGRIHSFEHRAMSLAERLMSTFSSPCRKHHEVYGYVSLELDTDTWDMYPDLMRNHRPFRPQESHSVITKRHRKHNSYRPNKSRHPTSETCSIVESSIVRTPIETEHVGCIPEWKRVDTKRVWDVGCHRLFGIGKGWCFRRPSAVARKWF